MTIVGFSRRTILFGVAATVLAGCGGGAAGSPLALPNGFSLHRHTGSSPIQHVVIIVQENRSFNNLFAGFPGANAPTYTLKVGVATTQLSVIVDITSGRPDAQVDSVIAYYQLIEIATGKAVLTDQTFAHVDYDIPGAAQRFAKQRAQRDAEDRATEVVSDAIRNRLASYFVAGT